MKDFVPVSYYYIIKVLPKKNADVLEYFKWDNLTWELRLKYDWYFKYRAALLQVKYPRMLVEVYFGNEPAVGKTKKQILLSKMIAKKAKITGYKNKLKMAEKTWSSIFPISEDVFYKKAVLKIASLETELIDLNNLIYN